MKAKFLIASLTSCSGCIATIFALDIFLQFLERVDLVYFPFMNDNMTIEENDNALVEGCVTDENQIELLKKIRKASKKVIALGTCAAFGGILNLSNKIKAEPISNYIEIDGFIPGCPPPSKLLGNSIINLLENKEIVLPENNMCSSCPLRITGEIIFEKKIENLIPTIEGDIDKDLHTQCFLKDGILCLGPITRDGCETKCIKFGIPCEGCMGPITEDFTANLINFLSVIKISNNLRNYEGIYYRFSKPKIERREE